MLRGGVRRGPKGHDPAILWRCYATYYYLGVESVSALVRLLHDNPFIALACGINAPEAVPSQPTFSRFGTKLARAKYSLAVKNVLRSLTRRMYATLPDFGKSVAIDATDIKGWSNAAKKGVKMAAAPRRAGRPARPRRVSDPDAGWCVKRGTNGLKKYVWGYKVHILADTTYELPMAVNVTAGNVADVKKAPALLQEARVTHSKFHPQYVICDAGYSDEKLRRLVRRQYRGKPIIDPNPHHYKAVANTEKTAEWRMVYNRRSSIERLNGRLKGHRRLNSVRVRGHLKVAVHAMLSIIACQAQALATQSGLQVRRAA